VLRRYVPGETGTYLYMVRGGGGESESGPRGESEGESKLEASLHETRSTGHSTTNTRDAMHASWAGGAHFNPVSHPLKPSKP
jgi:hypothetical protein